MATALLKFCTIYSLLSLSFSFVSFGEVSLEKDDEAKTHKIWIKPVVQLVQRLKPGGRIWTGPWNYDARGRQLPPGSQCWYCNVYFGSSSQFPGQDEDAAKVECTPSKYGHCPDCASTQAKECKKQSDGSFKCNCGQCTLSKYGHCPDCASTEAKECKKHSDGSFKCNCGQCTIKNVRRCPPCPEQLEGKREVQACEELDDGTSECRCARVCSSDKSCEADNVLCHINKKISTCQSWGTGGNACVCTKKCNKIADCEMLDRDKCNPGLHTHTCKNGGLGGLFPPKGTCHCTPKKCKTNAICDAKCPQGKKFYCPYATGECACVPNEHCDFDKECPECPRQKRYCGKYHSYTGDMRKNRCNCINKDQCQQNGDCPTLKCCISQKSTTSSQYPYERFGVCDTYRHVVGKGCPHGNVDGIEARNPKGNNAPSQGIS